MVMGKDELTGAEEAFTQDGSNLAAGAYQFGQVNVTFDELNVIIHLYLLRFLSSNLMRVSVRPCPFYLINKP
jgi:hypothetical protein